MRAITVWLKYDFNNPQQVTYTADVDTEGDMQPLADGALELLAGNTDLIHIQVWLLNLPDGTIASDWGLTKLLIDGNDIRQTPVVAWSDSNTIQDYFLHNRPGVDAWSTDTAIVRVSTGSRCAARQFQLNLTMQDASSKNLGERTFPGPKISVRPLVPAIQEIAVTFDAKETDVTKRFQYKGGNCGTAGNVDLPVGDLGVITYKLNVVNAGAGETYAFSGIQAQGPGDTEWTDLKLAHKAVSPSNAADPVQRWFLDLSSPDGTTSSFDGNTKTMTVTVGSTTPYPGGTFGIKLYVKSNSGTEVLSDDPQVVLKPRG